MLEEFFLAYLVQNIDKKMLARDYFFTYQGSLYRPIWTLKAEEKGSRILFYFYSIFLEPTKIGTNYDSNNGFVNWHLNKWSRILAWNKYHMKYLKTKTDDQTTVSMSGPISFADTSDELVIPDNSIAVFDYEKYKISINLGFGSLKEYQCDKNNLQALFLLQIQMLTAKYGYWMVFKKKKDTIMSSKRQLNLYKKLSQFPNVLFVNPLISA